LPVQNAMTRLAFILALLFTAPWQEAEIVDVKDRGAVDLKPFNCRDITRSSSISRVCYDSESRRMLVQRHAVYRQYCDLPKDTLDALLEAGLRLLVALTAVDGLGGDRFSATGAGGERIAT